MHYRSPGDPAIAIYLLHERFKSHSSYYYPYIQALPPPLSAWTMTSTAKSALPDDLANRAVALSRVVDLEYDALKNTTTNSGASLPVWLTRDGYRWAQSLVISRAFEPGQPGTAKVLLPGIDFLNHGADALLGPFWDHEANAAEFYADRDFYPGDEVFSCYGGGRGHWWLTHGFAG